MSTPASPAREGAEAPSPALPEPPVALPSSRKSSPTPPPPAGARPAPRLRLSALEMEEAERMQRRMAHGWNCVCCDV